MNTYFVKIKTLLLAGIGATLITSCDGGYEDGGVNQPPSAFSVDLSSNGTFGNILINQENQSMYFFAGDVTGESNCSGGCAETWPAVVAELEEQNIGNGLDVEDFGNITLGDGRKQLTYKGWPLYYFSPEADGVLEAPGEVLGDGRGGLFHVAKPDYTILVGRQSVEDGEEAVVYLVDDRGVSLYLNTGDEENISHCNGVCAEVWPPFNDADLVVPSSLELDDFGSLEREDELGPQLSFKGSPLYFFFPDEEIRGNVLGKAGGPSVTFFVVEPVASEQ